MRANHAVIPAMLTHMEQHMAGVREGLSAIWPHGERAARILAPFRASHMHHIRFHLTFDELSKIGRCRRTRICGSTILRT